MKVPVPVVPAGVTVKSQVPVARATDVSDVDSPVASPQVIV